MEKLFCLGSYRGQISGAEFFGAVASSPSCGSAHMNEPRVPSPVAEVSIGKLIQKSSRNDDSVQVIAIKPASDLRRPNKSGEAHSHSFVY